MLALLAAGQSSRFGNQDKLTTMLGDRMLGLHAAETAAAMPFVHKLVIASPEHGCAARWSDLGYQIIPNDDAALGQATSVRIAAAHAIQADASALCILLADMPFVTRSHLDELITTFTESDSTVASACQGQAMPPAIFPADALRALIILEGDSGARRLLTDARSVPGDDTLLMDIDSAEDLDRANIIFGQINCA